jgi:S1-C subfamily serine protease
MGELSVLKIDMPLSKGAQPKADETSKRLYEDSRQSIVQTITDGGKGTGFAVGPNLFVTDAHCVQGDKEIKIIGQDGTKYRAKLVDIDDINDLALLEIVSDKPINFKPLELGKSESLKPDDRVYAVGHPLGLPNLYISPGYHREQTTQRDVYNSLGAKEVGDPNSFKLTPKEAADFNQFQSRPMLWGRVHIEHGNSGGPLLNESGRVVGVSDLGSTTDSSNTFYTPVERVNAMLGRSTPKFKFEHQWQSAEWLGTYKDSWKERPAETAAMTGFAGYGAYISRRLKGKPEAAAALGGVLIIDDASDLYHSNHFRDQTKNGTATAGDVFMLGGGAISLLTRFKASEKILGKVGPYGKLIAGGGAALRLGAEFIPNRLTVTDMSRTDGEVRAPFRVDLRNLTPAEPPAKK